MGQASSSEQKLYIEILQRILKEQGFSGSAFKFVKLSVCIGDHSPRFPTTGTYDSKTWAKVGEQVYSYRLMFLMN